ESFEEDLIQLTRRSQITAEGLFNDNPGVADATGARELLDDCAEGRGRDGQVECGTFRRADLPAQSLEQGGIVIIPADEPQQTAELIESFGIHSSLVFHT